MTPRDCSTCGAECYRRLVAVGDGGERLYQTSDPPMVLSVNEDSGFVEFVEPTSIELASGHIEIEGVRLGPEPDPSIGSILGLAHVNWHEIPTFREFLRAVASEALAWLFTSLPSSSANPSWKPHRRPLDVVMRRSGVYRGGK